MFTVYSARPDSKGNLSLTLVATCATKRETIQPCRKVAASGAMLLMYDRAGNLRRDKMSGGKPKKKAGTKMGGRTPRVRTLVQIRRALEEKYAARRAG